MTWSASLLAVGAPTQPLRNEQLWEQISRLVGWVRRLTPLFILTLLAGWGFNALHIPVSWLLGPMLAGILYVAWQDQPPALPTTFNTVGQAIIALATAARFSHETLLSVATYAGPLMVCIFITGSFSLFNGYLLSRWAGIDRATGFLSCIPGAGASIVALSEEMGADAVTVAVLQYLRILLVSALVPALVGSLAPVASTPWSPLTAPSLAAAETPLGISLGLLTLVGGVGVWAGLRLKLPAPLFLGPFLAGLLAVNLCPLSFQVSPTVFMVGLLLTGLSIGVKFNGQTLRRLFKAVAIEAGLVLVLILVCLGVGYGFHCFTQVDATTAILGSTPGGLSAMIASAVEMGGDSGMVLAMQISRMLLIILLSPWFASWLTRPQREGETR
jgi:hypothetical protein